MSYASDFWSSSAANGLKCLPFEQAWPFIPQWVKEEMVRNRVKTPAEIEQEVEAGEVIAFSDGREALEYLMDFLPIEVEIGLYGGFNDLLPQVCFSSYILDQLRDRIDEEIVDFIYYLSCFLSESGGGNFRHLPYKVHWKREPG